MKRDGRGFDHRTLEAIWLMAVERVRDGESASSVIASYGFSRTTICKWLRAVSEPGVGLNALLSKPATGRPRRLTPRRQRKVFRWIDGRVPRQFRTSHGRPKHRAAKCISGMSWGFVLTPCTARTWGVKGQAPVVERAGQRHSISAASAVNVRGAFWYCIYQGGLTAELFISLLRRMLRHRPNPVHLVVDGLPAHKTALVKSYVASTHGRLTLHFLPGYAPDPNPDELAWSHMKRTGVARTPLRKGEKLRDKIEAQLAAIGNMPQLVRSVFMAPSVAYIADG